MAQKLSKLNIVLGYWNENMNQNFRFNNPKTMFKLDNFGVILFVSFSYKKLLQSSFYENWKNRCKYRFFRKKLKKVCVLQRRACNEFKFQTQLSRKLQRFRTCRKHKKCSIFMIFPNIPFFHMVVNYWTDPLNTFLNIE